MNFKAAVRSLRVRATPLVLAGVIMGVSAARLDHELNWVTVLFLALTAVFLQFVSNLSNELGDAISGTDTAEREGMRYSIQNGELTQDDLKVLIASNIVLSCLSGLAMIQSAFGTLFSLRSLFFIVLGICAIAAAMKYTLGKNPYGYRGLGDLFVFLFFGLAVVCGGYYLCTGEMDAVSVLPAATAMGFFSVGVLNVNNIRDMKTDAATRRTTAIRLGEKGSRIYHSCLIIFGWLCMILWSLRSGSSAWGYAYVLTLPLFIIHLVGVWKNSGHKLDKMVPILAMSTFLLSLLTLIR